MRNLQENPSIIPQPSPISRQAPHFALPPFFQTRPITINFKKVNTPYEGKGVRTMISTNLLLTLNISHTLL